MAAVKGPRAHQSGRAPDGGPRRDKDSFRVWCGVRAMHETLEVLHVTKRGILLLLMAAVLGLALIPAGATGPELTEVEPSTEVIEETSNLPDPETQTDGEEVEEEIVEVENTGPTELDYLESINTYCMYIFAFGVLWVILKVCSLVYKLLRIFI